MAEIYGTMRAPAGIRLAVENKMDGPIGLNLTVDTAPAAEPEPCGTNLKRHYSRSNDPGGCRAVGTGAGRRVGIHTKARYQAANSPLSQRSRRMNFWILPDPVRGNSSTKTQ